ncbi:MAG: DUF3857 domain-containing protein [Myxococcota bacterium]
MKKLLLLTLATACAAPQTPQTREAAEAASLIAEVRRRAAAEPNDPALAGLLAEMEFFGEAGDPARARPALDRALTLAGPGRRARLELMSGWEYNFHGQPREALGAYVRAVEAAKAAAPSDEDGAWAPLVAEVAFDALRGLEGNVPGYAAATRPLLEGVLASPGGLGHAAVDAAAVALMQQQRKAGEADALEATAERAGCLREWRAAGPFRPHPNLTFDVPLPAEGAGPLAETYDLGPAAEGAPTFEGEVDGCLVTLENEEHATAGTTIAETFVEAPVAGPYVLRLDTDASVKVHVDGELVRTVDRRNAIEATYIFVPLELTAGRHEVELKLSSRRTRLRLAAALDRPGRLAPGYDPARGVTLPEAGSPTEALLVAYASTGRGDPVTATALVGTDPGGELASAALTAHRQNILNGDPFLPDEDKQELTQRMLSLAHARDPEAVRPAVAEIARGDDDNAIFEALRTLSAEKPEVTWLRYLVVEFLEERGRPQEAEAALRGLMGEFPGECRPVEKLQSLLRDGARVAEANALVDARMACDASSTARFALLLDQRRWDDAQAERERLAALQNERERRGLELQLATQRGDRAAVQRLQAEIDDEAPESRRATTRRVDRLLATGDRRGAMALLDAAAERDPTRMEGLRNLRRDLTGQDDMEAFRIDGRAALRDYREREDPYPDAPQVLVLDYMVTRVYADGSARHLVHQITRVQSEEAKDRLGQYRTRGRMLTLRTIKPDGRELEPERIRGVNSIPLTELAIGDYLEEEYIWTTRPRVNGGFLSSGWSFSSPVQPFHRSELLAVVPEGMELVVERTGDAPPAERTTRSGETVYRWKMEGVPIFEQEPATVPRPELRPTMRFGVDAGWAPWFLAEHDFLMDKDPSHPVGRALCRDLVNGAESREDAAGRVARWVRANIEPAGESWGASGPAMLLAGEGNPLRVARYVMNECDLGAEVALVRNVHEADPSELADGGLYDTALFYFPPRDGEDELFLSASGRDASWRWIPGALRGQDAVVLREGYPRVRVPDPGPEADLRTYRAEVELGPQGAATVRAEERHLGGSAANLRQVLRRVPAAELSRVMRENYVGGMFPGAQVAGVDVVGAEDADAPLSLAFAAQVPNFGRPAGGGLRLPPLFAADLARGYAQLQSRRTAQGIGGQAFDAELRVTGITSPGETVAAYPPVRLEGPDGATYAREAVVDGDAVVVRRRLRMAEGNVTPEGYPAFAAFCRAVSEAETAELPVRPAR